jgi:quercetin dioxygenase-like cupin family protein
MAPPVQGLEPAVARALADLITPTEQGIASRVLVRTPGGSTTLFAFDAGQEISTHSTSFEALAFVLDGAVTLTIGEATVRATPGTVVRLPANVPHAVAAPEAARMLLVMYRTDAAGDGRAQAERPRTE